MGEVIKLNDRRAPEWPKLIEFRYIRQVRDMQARLTTKELAVFWELYQEFHKLKYGCQP